MREYLFLPPAVSVTSNQTESKTIWKRPEKNKQIRNRGEELWQIKERKDAES